MKVGLQLYSVRNALASDPVKTIRAIAEMGYRYLEPAVPGTEADAAGEFGIPTGEFRRLLDETGAKIVSVHTHRFNREKSTQILDFYASFGAKYIMITSGSVNFDPAKEDVLKEAEFLSETEKQAKTAGLQLVYHNHYHEFKTVEGNRDVLDLLLGNCDPSLVKLQLDTYWAFRAGRDPAEIMKKYGKRLCMLHQKDYPRGFEDQINVNEFFKKAGIPMTLDVLTKEMEKENGILDKRLFTEIGTGVLPIQSYIDCANEYCTVDYIILEQDASQIGEMESVKASMAAFKKLKGIEW
jgi:sugar phosphate isomerase/epimerase